MGARELQKNNWPERYGKVSDPILYQLQTVIRAREDFLLAKYLLKIFIFKKIIGS